MQACFIIELAAGRRIEGAIMRAGLIVIWVCIGLFLTSCSTVGKAAFNIKNLDEAKLEQVEAGSLSIFMYEFLSGSYVQSTFENIETGETYKAVHYGTHLSINFVPPGKYQFVSWENFDAANAKKRLGQDKVYRYFEPFEVAAGETVYIGSIDVDREKIKYTEGKSKDALTTVLFPFYDPNSTIENVYSVEDKSQTVKSRWINGYHPELKGKMVTRLISHNDGVTSNAVLKVKRFDKAVATRKEVAIAQHALEDFVDEHGQDNIANDSELSSKYKRLQTAYTRKRLEFIRDFLKYNGDEGAQSGPLATKYQREEQQEIIDELVKAVIAKKRKEAQGTRAKTHKK